jgi:hypothetical protein
MCDVVVDSAQALNIRWLESAKKEIPLSTVGLFYLVTKGWKFLWKGW